MNPLQVQLLTGPAAGRRARFERSPITFGRDAANTLVIDHENVSRQHGEIRFENGHWVLYNASANGAKINGKTVKEGKERPIESGDEVSVGKTLLFSLSIEPVEADAGEASLLEQEVDLTGDGPPRKRSRLWLGIGAYMAALLGLVIFLATLKGGGGATENSIPDLSREKIEEYISEPLPKQPAREDKYSEAVDEANRLFAKRDISPEGHYEAYRAYQTALSYAPEGRFKPEDYQAQNRYVIVYDELVDKIWDAYQDANIKLNRGDDEGAVLAFERLTKYYRATTNPLYKNIEAKRNLAAKRHGGKIRKR